MTIKTQKLLAQKLLAFDTSTEAMFIAITDGVQTWQHTGAGGANTSAALIPAIMALLQEAGMALIDLDAIVFGRGPGSFTGLRTACSVAQGLAFGAGNLTVLPVDTLLAVAEEARFTHGATQLVAMLDARMSEVYTATYAWQMASSMWQMQSEVALVRPEMLKLDSMGESWTSAGNMPQVQVTALPTATAMLRLAPAMLAAGQGLAAEQALPLYIRDKVAQTTAERTAIKLATEAAVR